MLSIKLQYFKLCNFLPVRALWFMCVAVYLDWLLQWEPWSAHAFPLGMPSASTKRGRERKYTIEEKEELNHQGEEDESNVSW